MYIPPQSTYTAVYTGGNPQTSTTAATTDDFLRDAETDRMGVVLLLRTGL
jgi:hypothetical protein